MKRKSTKNIQKEETIPYKKCLNCGTYLQGTYCHKCGQQASNPTPKIWEFILEYLNNAFIWDSKCIQTIWQLIRRPGFLTNEFNAGKFVAYEHPLKLNMFFLFVFVTLFFFFSDVDNVDKSLKEATKHELVFPVISLDALTDDKEYFAKIEKSERDTITLSIPSSATTKYPKIIAAVQVITSHGENSLDTIVASVPKVFIEDKILTSSDSDIYSFTDENGIVDKILNLEALVSIWQKMVTTIAENFPLIILFTSPLLAFAIHILHRKRRKPLITHFIFALHYTAFIELILLLIYFIYLTIKPDLEILEWFMIISSCLYLILAVKNVYHTHTWIKSIVEAFLISFTYLMICFCIFCAITLFAAFVVLAP